MVPHHVMAHLLAWRNIKALQDRSEFPGISGDCWLSPSPSHHRKRASNFIRRNSTNLWVQK